MLRCYVYVDGEYVRSELEAGGQPSEFDPRIPAAFVRNLRLEGAEFVAVRVFFYDAIDEQAEKTEREQRQEYFGKVARLPDTHIVLGEVRRGRKKREQKGVDVLMAIDSLRAATSGAGNAVALVTGDADFAPLARAIREVGPHVLVLAFSRSLSESLAREADRVFTWDAPPTDWTLKA